MNESYLGATHQSPEERGLTLKRLMTVPKRMGVFEAQPEVESPCRGGWRPTAFF
jgi:hypothetical protein